MSHKRDHEVRVIPSGQFLVSVAQFFVFQKNLKVLAGVEHSDEHYHLKIFVSFTLRA